MRHDDFYIKGLGIEIRAVGPLAITVAGLLVTLLILSFGRAWWF